MTLLPDIVWKSMQKTRIVLSQFIGPSFICPVCNHHGVFCHISPASGFRKYARCPNCNAMERHRLQYLAMEDLSRKLSFQDMKMLHIAPEPFFKPYFHDRFKQYETADLFMDDVDYKIDLTSLPFQEESYDFVYASHVLEHINDDSAALWEIRRILRPGGVAVLPVPLVCRQTIEYEQPNPAEAFHVRAPGYEDYFDRYRAVFDRVDVVTSEMFLEKYQPYIYEDRSQFPNAMCPHRTSMPGTRHIDAVPVCYV